MDDRVATYLALLDLAPGATMADVKRAYRELALIWHPDKVPDRVKDRATAKFQSLTEAYQWIARNPSVLAGGGSYSSARSHTNQGSSQKGSAGTRRDPYNIAAALRGLRTDRDEGVYVYPDVDRSKLHAFTRHISRKATFPNYSLNGEDILLFYDIDGSGEEGMAITRQNHVVNNNVDAIVTISELEDVRLEEAMFFWSQVSVRQKGHASFQLAGYTSNHAGRIFTEAIRNIIRPH